jgi:hypothetical protein
MLFFFLFYSIIIWEMEGNRTLQNSSLLNIINRDNLATQVMSIFISYLDNDNLKGILNKSTNYDYKPSKDKHLPKIPDSPFGDFPKEYKLKPITKQPSFKE